MKNRNLDHKDDWATPPKFYDELNKEFNFDFDPCPFHHDMSWDGTEVDWGQRNFVNPPYSQKLKEAFINKALEESKKWKTSVLLIPCSTSTKIFHDVIKPNAKEIRFVRGRLPFRGINSKWQKVNYHLIWDWKDTEIEFEGKIIPEYVKNSGMHDSMIVIF